MSIHRFTERFTKVFAIQPKAKAEMINQPKHYNDESGVPCCDVTDFMMFNGGNCFKYLYRCGSKFDDIEDLKKAVWYAKRAGEISDLELQPKFELVKGVKFSGDARAKPAVRYFADFAYTDTKTGKRIVEDVKSPVTKEKPSYKMKRHMMLAIHGIEVLET